ncbi:MAG TPA: DUF2339 domain-containing protein [Pyrinomonadaceae bacterium]|jgi:uncharacterized membrane protein|nr:DUF2339 domain-containing protein [Pyrinomonadaceae bacterium]
MTDDQSSSELLKQLIERLDLLERVMGMNTARLHSIEKHLEIPRKIEKPPVVASEQPAAQLKTENLDSPEANQPTAVESPVREFPDHQWSQPAPQMPSGVEPAEKSNLPGHPGTHSWMKEALPKIYDTRKADTPSPLHVQVEKSAAVVDQIPRGPQDSEAWQEQQRPEKPSHEKRRDIESVIGGSWFNWIGIIAVTLGVGFFLKLAIDNGWIGPSGRVGFAALLGISLLYLGERLRKRGLQSYAYILSGGGILVLYLADYAAYDFYHLIGQTTAFLLMAIVTTTAVLLSVWLNALPIAILGLIGGFLTPVMLSSGVDNEVGLFTYVALLDAGVLAIAYFKSWRSLDFLSFAGTVAIGVGWALGFWGPEKVWTTLFFLSVFFLLYGLLAFFHNVLPGRPTRWFDVSLAIANATIYFGLSYLMLTNAGFDQATPATQALLLAVFFIWLFYATWRWSSDDRLLRYSYVGAAATFLSMAVAIQLELHWVTIGWAVEALMLAWIGLRSGEMAARHAGMVLFCVAVGHWFIWDMTQFTYGADPSFVPLFNRRALSSAVLIGAIAGAAWLYKRASEIDESERQTVRTFCALTGNAVALTLLSLDLNDFFLARLSRSGAVQTGLNGSIENSRQFTISALWTLYAATTLSLGVLRRFTLLRLGGLLLLLTAIIKVVAFDSAFYQASWHLPVFNQTFMAYALLVGTLAFAAWLYNREAEPERSVVRSILLLAANALALGALSLEVFGYYSRLQATLTYNTEIFKQFQEGKLFTLTLVWIVYATGVFLFGVWRNARAWRWGGIVLLGFTTSLVLVNLMYYDAPWHALIFNRTFSALAAFVLALWIVVRTYARSRETFAEASLVRPLATILANLVAIVALSAQAAGYYDAQIAAELSNTGVAAYKSGGVVGPLRNLELAKQLSLSVIWLLYASGLFVAGRGHRLRLLRLMGLGLLSLTTLKVFFWDLSALNSTYRIISFIMLGAILLVVSYFYQRSLQPTEEKEQ